jgi:hypothetical protein
MDNDNQLAVFEDENDNNDNGASADRERSRALLVVSAIAALMLAILIIALVLTKPSSEREAENLVRAGSPEFDAYKDKVVLEVNPDDRLVYENWIGMWQIQAKGKLSNRGDRELIGVEVVGKMLGLDDKVIAHGVGRPVPSSRKESLKPGESVDVVVKVDAPPKIAESDVKDFTVELRGLRFQ